MLFRSAPSEPRNKFGEYPRLGAKLLRGSDGAWARQSAVSDAAPGSSAAEHGGGGVLGLVAARGWMGEAQGVRGGQLKAGRDLGVRAVGHAGENLAGKLGSVSLLGKEGKGEEGADTRGRPVSGGERAMRWARARAGQTDRGRGRRAVRASGEA